MAKSAQPSLLFSQMKTPDVSYSCQKALLKTSHMRTLHLEKEAKGGGIMGKKLCDTLKPSYCLIWERKKAVVNMNWLALTMEELNIIIGLVNPWPVLFQHQQRTSHPMQMASRTISSNDWLPHKWEKFYLLLHLLMITNQMPLTIIWMAALNLNVTCKCCWNTQYTGKEHFQSTCLSPLFKEYKRKKGGTLNLYTNPTLSWRIKRWGK